MSTLESGPLVQSTDRGLFCPLGGFYIDPWKGVERAVVTHAHTDHCRRGSRHYLTSAEGAAVVRERLGDVELQTLPYGEPLMIGPVRVTLHPAGHLIGSAQVRLEHAGRVTVVSGDYKTQHDPTCAAFEPLPCDTFITESTFGLPVYRWPSPGEVFTEINTWWRANQLQQRVSVIFCYALGKAQRVLAGLDPSIGPILVHGAIRRFLPHYAAAGVQLPGVQAVDRSFIRANRGRVMVVAPTSANGTAWLRKLGPVSTAFASGWMQMRGTRRWQSVDRGFVLSDHADWNGLLGAIRATGARHVGVTHGYISPMVRYLRENGWDAFPVATRFEMDAEERAEQQSAELAAEPV